MTLTPDDLERLDRAIDVRIAYLADPTSIGAPAEEGAAEALAVLVDIRSKVRVAPAEETKP
jgi:hypothetical protein